MGLSAAVRTSNAGRRPRSHRIRAGLPFLVYNQSCEDPRPDLEGLDPRPGDRLLTIASGGCNVLHLAMTGAHVVAVDRNPAQVALTRLKVGAARQLDAAAFRTIFGTGMDPTHRLSELYLSDDRPSLLQSRRWFAGTGLFSAGVLGRASRLLRAWVKLVGADDHVAAAFAAPTMEGQVAHWSEAWRRLVAGPSRALLAGPLPLMVSGVPLRVIRQIPAGSLGVACGVDRVMRTQPAAELWFWQQMMLGEYRTARPPYLDGDADRLGPVSVRCVDLRAELRDTPTGSMDGAALLDAMYWLPAAGRHRVWADLHRSLRPGARVTMRLLDRTLYPPSQLFVPEPLTSPDRTGCYVDAVVYHRR